MTLLNITFKQDVSLNREMMDQTYSGLLGATTLPRRAALGFFYAPYPNPHLLINGPEHWQEYPNLAGVSDDKASFGVVDNIDQIYISQMWNNLQTSVNRYCILAVNAGTFNIYTRDLIPADFGPYYGNLTDLELLKKPVKTSDRSFLFYSVFKHINTETGWL